MCCSYRLSKLAGQYNRNLTPYELDKCKKDTIAFDGANCFNNVLDFCLKLRGEERKVKKTNFSKTIYNYTHILELDLILG